MKARIGGGTSIALFALVISLIAFGGTGAVASDGDPVLLGNTGSGTRPTVVNMNCQAFCLSGDPALIGRHLPDSNDVDPAGVYGFAGAAGLPAWSGPIGTLGESGGDGVVGLGARNGVSGESENTTGSGVYGQNDSAGYGVTGRADNGTGVLGQGGENGVDAEGGTFGVFAQGSDYGVFAQGSAHGIYAQAVGAGGAGVDAVSKGASFALRVSGKVQLSRSGTATIASGQSSAVVSNVALSAKSLVLATAQKNVGGVYVQAAVPNVAGKTVTIYLNKSVGATYPVAWMIVEKP